MFELSQEHEEFRRTIRDFVDREIRPVAREWEQSGRYPEEIVATMRTLGLFGLSVPAEHGGLGADTLTLAIVFEEISRGWMGVAGILGTHSLSCATIARHGTDEQRATYLPALASGERRSGVALTEPGAGSDLQAISTTARRDGSDYVIRGAKTWITNARHADPLLVLAKTDPSAEPRHAGMSLFLVEQGSAGFSVSRDLPKLGYRGPETCEVILEDVRVPASSLLGGSEGLGFKQIAGGLEIGRINIAARAVGVAQEALDRAISYAREREAFGKPIGEHQAIQLKIADMATEVQAARLMTWWAAWKYDQGERADLEAGMAKYFASEVALRSALESMRVHGGYGYSEEFEVARLYRDAPLMAIGEGTNEIQRTLIARRLLRGTRP